MTRHVLVTGASAGIGAAVARMLAPGNRISLGARRVERLAGIVPDAFHGRLDVTDQRSVDAFLESAVERNGPVDVLVNNAGLARGVERIADADGDAWREMIETNVLGVLNVTRRVVPSMVRRGDGHVVMIGSIAAYQTYEGGSVYCASKRALQAIGEGLRLETLGTGVRVTSVDPGMVETEFSLVRFRGDQERAAKVYDGVRALTAEDVAECVAFAVSRPPHVDIDVILVKPTDQAAVGKVHRRT
jgi:3-hydroxy acid dehydrogenase/malonic semialdehyde reductase